MQDGARRADERWCAHRCCRRRRHRRRPPATGSAQGQQDHRDLHTGYPIRHWDNDLGPGAPHLLATETSADDAAPADLTPRPGGALRDADFDVSPDGRFVVTSWQRPAPGASLHRCWYASTSPPASTPSSPTNRTPTCGARPSRRTDRRWRSSASRTRRRSCAPRISLCYLRFGEQSGRTRRGLGSLAGVGHVVARRRRTDRHGRRGRPLPGVPDRIRDGGVEPLTADDYAYTDVTCRARRRRLRVAQFLRGAAASGAHRSRRHRHGVAVRRAARAARVAHRDDRDRRRRHLGAVVAGAARQETRRRRCCCGSTAAAGQLELLALAVEPVGARCARIRGAAAGSGAVDRLRAGLHPARLGRMGRCAVRRI